MFKPISTNATSRALKRRKIAVDSDDEFAVDADVEAAFADEGEFPPFDFLALVPLHLWPCPTLMNLLGLHC